MSISILQLYMIDITENMLIVGQNYIISQSSADK